MTTSINLDEACDHFRKKIEEFEHRRIHMHYLRGEEEYPLEYPTMVEWERQFRAWGGASRNREDRGRESVSGVQETPDECPLCGDAGRVFLFRGPYEASFAGTPFKLDEVERCRCDFCGGKFFTVAQSKELTRRVREIVGENS